MAVRTIMYYEHILSKLEQRFPTLWFIVSQMAHKEGLRP